MDVELKLATGGPLGSTQKNLWVISANAQDLDTGEQIPYNQISIGGFGNLDTNGNLYVVLPDDDPDSVTPQANGHRNYAFGVTAYEIPFTHTTRYPALTDTNRARLNLGVGEYVDFGGAPGDTQWTTSGGGLSGTNGSGTTFTAPSNAPPGGASVTVTATFKGQSVPTTFTVFPPSGYDHAVITSTHTNLYGLEIGGAIMTLNVYIAPTDVSFYRVDIMEVGENAINNMGFWAYDSSPNYYSTNDLRHSTADVWAPPLSETNTLPDNCGTPGYLPPWVGGGGFTWPIPARWRVDGDVTTNTLNNWSDEVFSMDPNGTVSVTKFHQTVTRSTNNVVNPSL